MNLWGEENHYLDVPHKCETMSFTTSFEVTFGIFICADAIHKFPAEHMIENGIHNFATPMYWTGEMAQMQAGPWMQGWSLRHCKNVLFANARSAIEAHGSGIVSCGRAPKSVQIESGRYNIVFADVDSRPPSLQAVKPRVSLVKKPSSQNTGKAQRTPDSDWQFAPLKNKSICTEHICCSANGFPDHVTEFVIAILDGSDSACAYGDKTHCDKSSTWPAKACAVFPCHQTRHCLQYHTPTDVLSRIRLGMTTNVDEFEVVPHVVATSAQENHAEQRLLEPGLEFNFSRDKSLAQLSFFSRTHNLVSIELYSRSYDNDTLPYNCYALTPDCISYSFVIKKHAVMVIAWSGLSNRTFFQKYRAQQSVLGPLVRTQIATTATTMMYSRWRMRQKNCHRMRH